MFASACAKAREFTKPIIISFRHHDGTCNCSIGSYVVINDEGYAVTAFHIVKLIADLQKSKSDYHNLIAKRESVENDANIKKHVKINTLKGLKINPKAITNFSIFLGTIGTSIDSIQGIESVDIAVFKIVNYDSTHVANYPMFKDPQYPMEQGTSLCKLGYPFHEIAPTFDVQQNRFDLPVGALPVPLFPIDGIFTRKVSIPNNNAQYPFLLLETSTPGLRGQSGGPTFDVNGYIWAIQSKTNSYKLGFGQNAAKNKEGDYMRNQYLNVGWGVHSETIIGFLTSVGINFVTSPN